VSRLKYSIKKYNIDLKKLFLKFDKSENENLDIDEFGMLLRKIDQNLNDEEI
jgi:serine/threonine-protein kinase ULK/ATG1